MRSSERGQKPEQGSVSYIVSDATWRGQRKALEPYPGQVAGHLQGSHSEKQGRGGQPEGVREELQAARAHNFLSCGGTGRWHTKVMS